MNYGNILKCLKAIQECKNGNKKSCDEMKKECLEKLLLELSIDFTKNIKKNIEKQKINDKNVIRYVEKLVYKIQQKYIEKIFNTKVLLDIFNYLKKIEQNKNNKEQLEQIKNKIEKNFNNEIKDHLIRLIDNYLTNLQQNEKNIQTQTITTK